MNRIVINPTYAKAVGFVLAAIVSSGFSSSANASPTFNDPADIKAITAIETFIQAQINIKDILSYYAPDAIVYDKPTPGVYRGTKQIYNGYEPQMAGITSIKVTYPDLNIVSDGTIACAAMQLGFKIGLETGATESAQYRDIDAFRKIDGKWKIVQSHLSFPVNAKTGMAVVDGPTHPVGRLNWSGDTIQTPAIDPSQAKSEIANWVLADAATNASDQLAPYYGPGDNTILYDAFYPGDARGIQQIENYYRPFFDAYKSMKPTIKQIDVISDGLLGAVMSQQDMALTAKDGSQSVISFRQNDCLHRLNGKWHSFFEMTSFPMDPKTGKSILSSPPKSQP